MMYAKLIIYRQDPVRLDWQPNTDELPESISLAHTSLQSTNQLCWQLTADNLTTGKISDLLVCLDELGFSDETPTPIDGVQK